MAAQFTLNGSYQSLPLDGSPSFSASIIAQINETTTIGKQVAQTIELASDSPEAVAFGDVVGASVVVIKAIGGKIRVRVTSADGSQQAVPCDSFIILMSETVPVTAIDLTRTTGVNTTVQVFLGETP
jgi:hypothetical protein